VEIFKGIQRVASSTVSLQESLIMGIAEDEVCGGLVDTVNSSQRLRD
jgi:hypothetical protein